MMGKTPVKYIISKVVTDKQKTLLHDCFTLSHPIAFSFSVLFLLLPLYVHVYVLL